MASTINAKTTGVGGIDASGDASGVLALQTGGTTAVTIDASQNVGIGTSSVTQAYSAITVSIAGNLKLGSGNAIGFISFGDQTSTTSNVGIWRGAGGNSITSGNYLQMGGYDGITFTTGNASLVSQTERMRIDSSGNLLVGTTSAVANARSTIAVPQGGSNEAPLGLVHGPYSHRIGPVSNGSFVVYRASDNVGQYQTYGATSWTSTSDERLKTDLIPIENGLDKVNSLRSVTGRFKTDEEGVSRSFLIAQDVQKVLPEAVSVQDDELGTLGVAYTEVIPLLVASIKELKAIIDTQNARIEALEAKQ